jgi:hypothetical protein
MLSESKKQNPKPAAGEHRVISRLKAAEEASKKIQAESESVVPEVAGVSQHQHTQGIAFKPAAEDFYPALGEQKEPSEGNGESSDSEEEASAACVQDEAGKVAEENPSKEENSLQPAKFPGSLEVNPSVVRSPKDLEFWIHFSDAGALRDEKKRVKLIFDILDKGKVDTYGLNQFYDTYKKCRKVWIWPSSFSNFKFSTVVNLSRSNSNRWMLSISSKLSQPGIT